jgi:hypothetical protein
MRMTSEALASLGQYSLSIDVLQDVQTKAMAAAHKETEIITNHVPMAALVEKKTQKAEGVLQAGVSLTVDNLEVLIQSRKQKGDSLMKSLREELSCQ